MMTRDLRALALTVSAIGMVGLFGLGADGAHAQGMWTAQAHPRPPAPIQMMPPHEVRTIVRSTGLTPAGPPVRRGELYIQPALDPYGRPMRVVVDADAGAVVSIRPAPAPGAGPHPTGPYPRYGALPPRDLDDDDDDLLPPRPVPNVRPPLSGERVAPERIAPITGDRPVPPAGVRTATRNPPTTPVPRPRPVTAPRDPAVAAVKPAADPTPTASVPQQPQPEAPAAATAPAAAAPEVAAPAETNAFPPVQALD